jgi:hypothetical protein
MSEVLIDDPMTTVNTLLKLQIGDEGRLLYLRNALKNGKVIFNSDKRFLRSMQEKLDQIPKRQSKPQNISTARVVTQKRLSEYNSNRSDFANKIYNLPQDYQEQQNSKKIENQTQVPDLEKILLGMSNSITELKKTQSQILTNLEILMNDHQNSPKSNQSFNEIIVDNLNKKNVKNKFTEKNDMKYKEFFGDRLISNKSRAFSNHKISDVLAWVTSGLFVVWFASFLKLIDIDPFQNLFLGLAAGLAVCVAVSHKLKK